MSVEFIGLISLIVERLLVCDKKIETAKNKLINNNSSHCYSCLGQKYMKTAEVFDCKEQSIESV